MKIPLKNFEKSLKDYSTLSKGKDYFEDNRVYKLKEKENLVFEAKVAGSDDYNVEIKLDQNNNITALYCDCPYDWGTYM